MQEETQIKVMVADDHNMFLEGLCRLLLDHDHIKITGKSLSAEGLLEQIREEAPDVVITDINMPGMGGLELIQVLKKEQPQIKTLALSMYKDPKIVSKAFRNGATGFIVKNTDQAELIKAIESVNKGETFIGSIIKEAFLEQAMLGKQEADLSIPSLSSREKEVLQLIAEEFTMNEIADQLHISHHTVLTHRRKLFVKLGAKNTAGLVKKAMEQGLL